MSAPKSPIEPFLKGETGRNTRGLLRIIILCTIAAAAVASRLFSVIRMFTASTRFPNDPKSKLYALVYLHTYE